ncbi:deazaflavin-dependent oxidoreductase (nitroreductase family) [Nocardia sp. GAS34]|uniref:nitroreductase family deazaflavin-dependent oxidoreductase n=1 Tax=unclassified Nocardia TaxID=2637762 RepID=UPI003D2329E5
MSTQFPDRRWGSRTSLLSRAMVSFAATWPGSLLIRKLTPLDRKLLVRTAGRYTMLGPVGAPVVLVTARGRKSGQPRLSSLLYVHGGDTLYVIGSNFGQSSHPAWTANLLADPEATVTLAGERIPVRATLIEDPARKEEIFADFVESVKVYATYRTRTTRDMRIFALTRS